MECGTYVCDFRNVTFSPCAAAISSPSADREMFGTRRELHLLHLRPTSHVPDSGNSTKVGFNVSLLQNRFTTRDLLGSRLQRVKKLKTRLVVSELLTLLSMMDIKSSRYSQRFFVTELVVSGTQCMLSLFV